MVELEQKYTLFWITPRISVDYIALHDVVRT